MFMVHKEFWKKRKHFFSTQCDIINPKFKCLVGSAKKAATRRKNIAGIQSQKGDTVTKH